MFSRKTIDLVTETANSHLVDIVGERVELHKSGGSYKGCCPFHTEKTPSFIVTPSKGMCYCFGCHKGGNAVKFIMELDKVSFPEAIRYLAGKYGIEVEETRPTPEQEQQNRDLDNLYALMEYAARAYQSNLTDHGEGEAMGLSYLRHRGIRDDVVQAFRLGYAVNAWDGLMKKALADGFREEYLMRAGLVKLNEEKGGKYDTFRGRVMFPILSPNGKVIAFSGRLLDERTKGVAAKYINSPETELFDKSKIVFGIYQAKQEMARKDKCFLVEGPIDAISMHQAGIVNVVATNGTALTTEQVKLIKRFTSNVTVLYDGDSAGVKSAVRAIDLFLQEGMNVSLLLLPDDDDPDSYVRKHPGDEFLEYVGTHETDFVTYKVNAIRSGNGDVSSTTQAIHSILASIALIQDAVQRDLFLDRCHELTGVSKESLQSELQKVLSSNVRTAQERAIQSQRYAQMQQGMAQQPQAGPLSYAAQNGQQVQQPQQETALDANDVAFKEVIRFFMTYPQSHIKTDKGDMTVAEFILSSLQGDNLRSRVPALNKVVQCYVDAPDKTTVDTSYFMNHAEADMTPYLASVLTRPKLSNIHGRHGAVVPEEQSLDEFVPRSVKELQWGLLEKLNGDQLALLKQLEEGGASEEEQDKIMKEVMLLGEVKVALSKEMGERAITR